MLNNLTIAYHMALYTANCRFVHCGSVLVTLGRIGLKLRISKGALDFSY